MANDWEWLKRRLEDPNAKIAEDFARDVILMLIIDFDLLSQRVNVLEAQVDTLMSEVRETTGGRRRRPSWWPKDQDPESE